MIRTDSSTCGHSQSATPVTRSQRDNPQGRAPSDQHHVPAGLLASHDVLMPHQPVPYYLGLPDISGKDGMIFGMGVDFLRTTLGGAVKASRIVARTISPRRPAGLSFSLVQYDAGWKQSLTLVGCDLPLSMLWGVHFLDGPMPLQETPHLRYFAELLTDEWLSAEIRPGEIEYLKYMTAQHCYSQRERDARLLRNRLLVEAYLAGARFTVLAVPGPRGTWILQDGFHRAALVLAAGKEGVIRARIAV